MWQLHLALNAMNICPNLMSQLHEAARHSMALRKTSRIDTYPAMESLVHFSLNYTWSGLESHCRPA